jgi:hypothetical protein
MKHDYAGDNVRHSPTKAASRKDWAEFAALIIIIFAGSIVW